MKPFNRIPLNLRFLAVIVFILSGLNSYASVCKVHLSTRSPLKTESQSPHLKYSLRTHREDGPTIEVFNDEQRQAMRLSTNSRGQLIYSASKQLVEMDYDQNLVGIWDIENGAPGELYATIESPLRTGLVVKHSSFNGNNPVLSAFNLRIEDGIVTEIDDGSGHYKPTPMNMFILIQHLQNMGLDLTSAYLNFAYGPEIVRGLRILALDFVEVVERMRPPEHEALNNLRNNRTNLLFYLKLISVHSDDLFTKNTVALYDFRNATVLNEKTLKTILEFLNDRSTTTSEVFDTLSALFDNRHPRIRTIPSVRHQPSHVRRKYYSQLKRIIVQAMASSKHNHSIDLWFARKEID